MGSIVVLRSCSVAASLEFRIIPEMIAEQRSLTGWLDFNIESQSWRLYPSPLAWTRGKA